MFPVRVEDAEVDRLPTVSIGIAAICAAAFLFTWVLPKNPDGMRADGFRDIVRYYREHPYLSVQQQFLDDYLSAHARSSFEQRKVAFPSRLPSVPKSPPTLRDRAFTLGSPGERSLGSTCSMPPAPS